MDSGIQTTRLFGTTENMGLRTRFRAYLLLLVSALGMPMLIWLCVIGYSETIKSISLRIIEEHNTALATAVTRELRAESAGLLETHNLYDTDSTEVTSTLITANEFRLRALLNDAHVHYFDVHDLSGRVIYTSHPDGVGSNHAGDQNFEAALAGTVTSQLDNQPTDRSDTLSPHTHLKTFAPIHGDHLETPIGILGLYGIVDSDALPFPWMRPLIAIAFASLPLALLMLGGVRFFRRTLSDPPGIGSEPSRPNDAEATHCHTITAQETERKRISRDLHDGIGQYLNAIKFHLQQITTNHDKRLPPDTRDEIEGVVRVVASATDEVRRISLALRPAMLDDLGLLATLNWLCREFSVAHPEITLHKHVRVEESDIPDRLKTTIYRILQEALTNVAKHSHATRVDITLEEIASAKGSALSLTVLDDGLGFDPMEVQRRPHGDSGLGMHTMRERAELAGGTLSICSEKNVSTCIQAYWPLP